MPRNGRRAVELRCLRPGQFRRKERLLIFKNRLYLQGIYRQDSVRRKRFGRPELFERVLHFREGFRKQQRIHDVFGFSQQFLPAFYLFFFCEIGHAFFDGFKDELFFFAGTGEGDCYQQKQPTGKGEIQERKAQGHSFY